MCDSFTARSSRELNKAQALACQRDGDSGSARKFFQKAVDVTPEKARRWMDRLDAEGVAYVVAPYEADAQLAYMSRSKEIAVVISEDSDMLAFGCLRVLFKMDKNGEGDEICLNKLSCAQEFNFSTWSPDKFLSLCILSGCDYLESIPQLGVRSAYDALAKAKDAEAAIRLLRFQNKLDIPKDYEKRFRQAFVTFRYQRVYDRRSRNLSHVNPLPDDILGEFESDLNFLGPSIEPEQVAGVCEGKLHPVTKEPLKVAAKPPSSATRQLTNQTMLTFLRTASASSGIEEESGEGESKTSPQQQHLDSSEVAEESPSAGADLKRKREPSLFRAVHSQLPHGPVRKPNLSLRKKPSLSSEACETTSMHFASGSGKVRQNFLSPNSLPSLSSSPRPERSLSLEAFVFSPGKGTSPSVVSTPTVHFRAVSGEETDRKAGPAQSTPTTTPTTSSSRIVTPSSEALDPSPTTPRVLTPPAGNCLAFQFLEGFRRLPSKS